jgi:hypothetical protein
MRVLLLLIAALCAGGVYAAEPDSAGPTPANPQPRYPYPHEERVITSPITDRFSMRGTFFPVTLHTQLHVDSMQGVPGTPGTLLNAEQDLGLKDHLDQGRIELIFRMLERHRLRVDYFGTDRDGDRPLDRSILFGGHTYMVGDLVQSDLQCSMLGFTYTYSFIRTQHFEVGAGLGLHLLQADAKALDVTLQQKTETSGVGVFPTPAIDATWAISQRFAWTARAQYLSIAVNNVSAALGDYHTDLQYRWARNFEIGVGYESIHAALNDQHSGQPAGFVLNAKGPEAFLRVSF